MTASLNDTGLAFQHAYLQAALMVSLLSVWVLVGLFFYLNRYTRREYFTIWTAAWLFYALWLTLGLRMGKVEAESLIFMIKQCCVSISAVFLLWGSLRFLGLPVRQTSFGMFMLFLVVWTFVSPQGEPQSAANPVAHLHHARREQPVRRRLLLPAAQQKSFVGAGMLSLGFLLWGVYLATYPLTEQYPDPYRDGHFVAAVLQLFIAVSMIVLVLEEVRHNADQVRAEIAAVRLEKEALQAKVLTAKEECQTLYEQMRLTEGAQKAYEELRRTQQVVVQQERLRALGQMASGIAHDINNAMCPITAYSELLLSHTPRSGERTQETTPAHQPGRPRCHRNRRSHARILPSRPGSGQTGADQRQPGRAGRRRTDASALAGPGPARGPLHPRRMPVGVHPRLASLQRRRISRSPHQHHLQLRGCPPRRRRHHHHHPFRHPPRRGNRRGPGAGIAVEVRDNGSGMDEKVRLRCLEPFFSTKAQRGGSGLGLAMVYGMVQRHEGNIEIESAPGQGTCVRLILPMLQPSVPSPMPKASASQPARSIRVLCIDDEPGVRELLHDCLENQLHKVSVAPGGKEGLEMFRSSLREGHPFQVVITDLGMPDMDGYHVARAIKAESPRTPILMLTGWGSMIKADGEDVPSVDAILSKPPRIQELNTLLHRLAANSA